MSGEVVSDMLGIGLADIGRGIGREAGRLFGRQIGCLLGRISITAEVKRDKGFQLPQGHNLLDYLLTNNKYFS